jgi:amino acid transporter
VWLPPVGALTLSLLGHDVLEPTIKEYYDVTIPWVIWPILGVALVTWWAYAGIALSEKLLIITGSIEIVIMVALAFTSLVDPGPGGFSFAPLNPGNFV